MASGSHCKEMDSPHRLPIFPLPQGSLYLKLFKSFAAFDCFAFWVSTPFLGPGTLMLKLKIMLSLNLNSFALSYLSGTAHLIYRAHFSSHRCRLRLDHHLLEEVHHLNRSGMVASFPIHYRHLARRRSHSRFGNRSLKVANATNLRSYQQ